MEKALGMTKKDWHLDPKFSVANILVIVSMLVLGAGAWFGIVGDNAAQSKDLTLLQATNVSQDEAISNIYKEIQVDKIDIAVLQNHMAQQTRDIDTIKKDIKSILLAIKP